MSPKIFKLIGDASSDFNDMKERGIIGSKKLSIRMPKIVVKSALIIKDVWLTLVRK